MEVVLKGVPNHITDNDLTKELKPFMVLLDIKDWTVEKPRYKGVAWIHFLLKANGLKFLKKHGKVSPSKQAPSSDARQPSTKPAPQPRNRDIARLHILKTPIYAEQSNRVVDQLMIQHLKHLKDQRLKAPAKDPKAPSHSCSVVMISCGKLVYSGLEESLQFVSETSHSALGTAVFSRNKLLLKYNESRLDINYNTIQDAVANEKEVTLTLVLSDPPQIFQKVAIAEKGRPNWERATHLSTWLFHAKYVPHCLVYRLNLKRDEYEGTLNIINSREIIAICQYHIPLNTTPEPFKDDYTSSMRVFEGKIQEFGATKRRKIVPFVLLFQVQALVWNNYLHPSGATQMLLALEALIATDKNQGRASITADSMRYLFQRIPYPSPAVDSSELSIEHLLSTVMKIEADSCLEDPHRTEVYGSQLPEHQAWVLKALVTPTRILLHGPDTESKNRVLRMFPKHSDYFLRVTFCDENGQDLSFNPRVSNESIFARYKKILQDGIAIAGRRYSFLGFSHSSLRSHSAWFLAPFLDDDGNKQNYTTIIDSLGNFKDIRIPAKCAARIGQAFSETPYALNLLKAGIDLNYIPDVKSADESRVFSDGVGTISYSAAKAVWEHLPMKSEMPTCFQIRLGGIKGMLSLDTRLTSKVICVRKESMMKFTSSDFANLGICDTASKPLKMVLNRQTIKIMEDMGTPNQWFIKQQNKVLKLLQSVTENAYNTSSFLEFQLIGNNVGLPRLIKILDGMGINYRRDRFMKSVVEHVVLRELRLLKHKARIPVDQGVTLFGVMDETGYLEENEIFVTFDKKYDKIQGRIKNTQRDGDVLVTRSPALHPGDVQFVKMVTPPPGHPLRSLRNCIVFSQKGDRDLPSQLSGGDLDGDLYSVIWDPKARPVCKYDPADYPRVVPEPLNRDVTREDMAEFLINFMATDVLGLIATRHQILADIKKDGTMDPQCVDLAELHSTAVDYSKTGIPVNVTKIHRSPKTRPDFLSPAPPVKLYDLGQIDHIADAEDDVDDDDGDGIGGFAKHRFHRSEKILGQLYRGIDEKKIWSEDVQRPIDMSGPSVWDEFLGQVQRALWAQGYRFRDISHERKMEEAWRLRHLYESAIAEHRWHYAENPREPITEVEAFCGSILNTHGSQTRRERDSSTKLKDAMDETFSWIVKLIRDGGGDNDNDNDTDTDNETESTTASEVSLRQRLEIVELCWACVVAGCAKYVDPGASYYGTATLESFRVIAASCLAKELGELLNIKSAEEGGGYVGVNGQQNRQQKTMNLPLR